MVFLSYYPLKQGLKHIARVYRRMLVAIFILLSIKTRIETVSHNNEKKVINYIFILLSIKTRIETQ